MESGLRIVFYDGQCPFCVGWIKFLLDRDAKDHLRFASLQSDWSSRFFERNGLDQPAMDSVLVWDGQYLHAQSEAIISIAEILPGIWHGGRFIGKLPPRIRDGAYTFIAERRHDLFGKKEKCWLPSEDYRRKFLDLSDPVYKSAQDGDLPEDNTAPDNR
ncbi:DUF393 domain-containing protein [Puniceicoccales bacterium CK1056]|uniref:DUF393 domain-containing protein n=1 Tax=Oceanipulchritudo coccoides TaxID=2706888 RepID=A0A6B2M282_9BACT|nr:DCC1-like thiol-disulfide oxidoreductase family protein [Oceanipulchritudo coccoides]NDV63111.1 DUF393 domain-containing protein [Oceanipulchritudo coccoides]